MPVVPSYGIIVGRFHVDELHDGHKEIFRQVMALHTRVFVFLGVAPFPLTQENPLDFLSRKWMIEDSFPSLTCLSIPDMRTDEEWSKELDRRIGEVAKYGEVALYGGRQSFISRYKGNYPALELQVKFPVSGTEIRDTICNQVRRSADFRAGIIHAVRNRFPAAMSTVDMAVLRLDTSEICLIHKSGDTLADGTILWRFPGGFVTARKDKSKVEAAVRETAEETGLEVTDIEHLGSFAVEDWRLRGEADQVYTDFFVGLNAFGAPRGEDDAAVARFFRLNQLAKIPFVEEHFALREVLLDYYNKKYYSKELK